MEEAPVHARALDDALGAGVTVGEDRLRALIRIRNCLQPRRDLVQRRVPGDALEPPLALAPDPPLRVLQPLGAVDSLQVARHLRAEEASRERMAGVAPDPRG